jgi:uncharacterized protein (DUF1800 family)
VDADEARHLLRRAGHGTRPEDVAPFLALSRTQAVDRVLDVSANPAAAMPGFLAADDPAAPARAYTMITPLGRWWTDRWVAAPSPFEEKLLLFFHDHFAVHHGKVLYGHQLWELMTAMRENQFGHWPTMVKRVSLSAAMLQYLDNAKSRVGQANENFSRELMELHLLGPGSHNQQDVAEAARAWTGHGIDDDDRYYRFVPSRHDDGTKTIFGVTRNWDGPALIDHVFTDATLSRIAARHLTARLWEFFAHPQPSAAVVDRLAGVFAANGFQLRPLLRALFTAEEFYAAPARGALARHPIEYAVDSLRVCGLTASTGRPEWYVQAMGQRWFEPATPRGWKPNGSWVTATNAIARAQFAFNCAHVAGRSGVLSEVTAMAPAEAVRHAFDRFGIARPSPASAGAVQRTLERERSERKWAEVKIAVTAVLTSPEMMLA